LDWTYHARTGFRCCGPLGGALKGDTEIAYPLKNIRWLRIFGVALAVILASFFIVTAITTVYAFILAFQARGTPDQAVISQFAAKISRWLIPFLEILLTLLSSAFIVRRTDKTNIIHGLLIGALVGTLNLVVTRIFFNHLSFDSLIVFLITLGLGWFGGFIGQKRRVKLETNAASR